MRRRQYYLVLTLVLLFLVVATNAAPPQQTEVKVWTVVAGSRKVYHCPGSQWYGKGEGKEMGECQAVREGYSPALGHGCGSTCP